MSETSKMEAEKLLLKLEALPNAMLETSQGVKKDFAAPFITREGDGAGQLDDNLSAGLDRLSARRPRILLSSDTAAINAAKERYSEIVGRYNELSLLYAKKLIPKHRFDEVAAELREAQMDYPIVISAEGRSKPVVAAKLPDSDYLKSGFPIADRQGPKIIWGDEQNGLLIGMRIADGNWRVGGDMKVELWVCNFSEKELRFQSTERPDVGLRVMMTGAGGK